MLRLIQFLLLVTGGVGVVSAAPSFFSNLPSVAMDPESLRESVNEWAKKAKDPDFLRESVNKLAKKRWDTVSDIVEQEQQCEDYNAGWIATAQTAAISTRHRRLICLPLEERLFDPPMGMFSHGHVQTGDKISLPSNFWQAIKLNNAEVPWLYSVTRVPGLTKERVEFKPEDEDDEKDRFGPYKPMRELDQVIAGPLDYRAPANYCFLPAWMMRALGIKPRDIVQVELITNVAPGSLAKLRPHKNSFSTTIANPQAVLETELRHYSSLTAGTTIAFDYNNVRYWFDVVELRSAPRGEKVTMIKVQDCDIATDFLTAKDVLKKKRRKKKKAEEEEE